MDYLPEIIIVAILVIALLVIKSVRDDRMYKKRLTQRLQQNWGLPSRSEYSHEQMQTIKSYYYDNIEDMDVDDITCNDIDFDAIYQRINSTCTSVGEEYLYALLRKPLHSQSELEERERVIELISKNEDERIKLQTALTGVGKMNKISVYDYIKNVDTLKGDGKWKHIFYAGLLLFCIAGCFVYPSPMIIFAIIVMAFNVIAYYKSKVSYEGYIQLFSFITRTVCHTKDVAEVSIKGIEAYQQKLSDNAACFKKFCKGSRMVAGGQSMGGDLTDSMMDYVRMLFHVDLIKMCSMIEELKKYKKELFEIYDTIGYIDSLVSIASYRAGLSEWCVPEFEKEISKENTVLRFQDIYHPLLSEPVTNSLTTKSCVLITGSNASGKSTFIKTVAINAILAQTIHTALAASYHSSFFRIYSSMALRDNIFSNESYYIVEIKSLKRILDASNKSEIPMLCFIDEVLRGTNTLERIASSAQILARLSKERALCFAATHDLELTRILSNYYDNYHFTERVSEDNVEFDYQIKKGSANTRNAIKLLKMIGYDTDITESAERAANEFLNAGGWNTL